MKLLFEAAAPVAAPIDSVRALIDDGWVLDAFLGRADARAYVDVDHRPGVVGFQSHWWYRGEISAAPAGTGTTLTYRVYHIAGRSAWAVPLANRLFIGYRKTVDEGAAGVAPGRGVVVGGGVDHQAVVADVVDQVAGQGADGVGAQATAVHRRIQVDVDTGVPVVRIVDRRVVASSGRWWFYPRYRWF